MDAERFFAGCQAPRAAVGRVHRRIRFRALTGWGEVSGTQQLRPAMVGRLILIVVTLYCRVLLIVIIVTVYRVDRTQYRGRFRNDS